MTKNGLHLENDDVLRRDSVVCLLDEIPDGEGKEVQKNVFVEGKGGYVLDSGAYQDVKMYDYIIGKIEGEKAWGVEVKKNKTNEEEFPMDSDSEEEISAPATAPAKRLRTATAKKRAKKN